ncbi:hypothetical protein ACIPWF_22820 [Paenarthrobacter sp. NPDC089989]|uniref:hypothetical protein n=1 Tax=unclassified Paenarthrobacter TaxID=2634190 RepID=UPI00381228C9
MSDGLFGFTNQQIFLATVAYAITSITQRSTAIKNVLNGRLVINPYSDLPNTHVLPPDSIRSIAPFSTYGVIIVPQRSNQSAWEYVNTVKRSSNMMPNGGLGYSLLKTLTDCQPQPGEIAALQLAFNYTKGSNDRRRDSSLLTPIKISASWQDPSNPYPMGALVSDRGSTGIQLRWVYDDFTQRDLGPLLSNMTRTFLDELAVA